MADGSRMRFSLSAVVLVALAATAFPALASAGTIAGTVSEAGGAQAPLAGVEVCSHRNPFDVEDSCTTTDAAGHYALAAAAGSYSVRFSDRQPGHNFADQYYGGSHFAPGTYVTVTSSDETVTGIDAQLQPGSTISGYVTEAATGTPLAGIPVCADFEQAGGVYERCGISGPVGTYAINGLIAGTYRVEFQSGQLNYQPQRYELPIAVSAPGETRVGINAAMKAGVEISGRVSEAGSGRSLAGIGVELLPVGREGNGFARTGPNGEFRFWGQREGDYTVLFSKPEGPFGSDLDCFAAQYFGGATSATGATVLHGVPGIPITGVDAALVGTCEQQVPDEGPPPLQVTFAPASTPVGDQRQRPLHCRKGSHRKRVKGKVRCVKKRKRHPHRSRHRHHAPPHGLYSPVS